jgi:hypothetical protein
VTGVPLAKLAEQAVGQLIPLGLLVTEPVPIPEFVIVSAEDGTTLKSAVTAVAVVRVMTQELAPAHPPPLHPVNESPWLAVAVRVTGVFGAKLALHVPGQFIPVGRLVTVPPPAGADVI